jgi:hypothetical protein
MFRRCVAVLICLAAALLAGTPAGGQPVTRPLRVLQLNLCDSGFAGCYSGRAVAAAASAIRERRPDVVTLNEICDDDVDALGEVLDALYPGETVARAFQPAYDRRTASPFKCRNDHPYGIGLLARVPAGFGVEGGLYPDGDTQDATDPEQRAWVCVRGAVRVCTTHLANTKPAVALAQCAFLFGTVAPGVLAGDLNLSSPLDGCVPSGYVNRDDGAVQHVIATGNYAVTAGATLDLGPVTDHPGLLVTLSAVRPR